MISRGLNFLFARCFYSYSSVNQKFIALALMVHPNDTYNTRENHNTPYNAFHDHMRQFNPPAQTPPLQQRASTGQLSEFLYPSAPLHPPQASSSWSQAPNTTPHSHSHQWSQNASQYQTMPPPVFTAGTPTPSGSGSTTKSRTFSHKLSVDKKLNIVFSAITKDAHWTLSEFLYFTFQVKGTKGKKISRSSCHATMVSQFLRGQTRYKVADILAAWTQSPDGRPQSSEDGENMYSPSTPFLDIKPARPAITSFAVQLIEKKLTQERNMAVRPSSGLHASAKTNSPDKILSWEDVGLMTVADITDILKEHQPLTWHYLLKLTTPKPRKRNGVIVVRKYRPPEVV